VAGRLHAPRGGIVGEALVLGAHHAVSALGAHILAVFLFVSVSAC